MGVQMHKSEIDYTVVSEEHKAKVKVLINTGWKLHGSLVINVTPQVGVRYSQALIKYIQC